MNLSAINNPGLSVTQLHRGGPAPRPRFDLREAAEQFVATSLLTPLMAQIRDDPFKSDLFHGGFTEDAFLRQFDQIIADRLSKRMSLPLVETIYQRFAAYDANPVQAGDETRKVDVHG